MTKVKTGQERITIEGAAEAGVRFTVGRQLNGYIPRWQMIMAGETAEEATSWGYEMQIEDQSELVS